MVIFRDFGIENLERQQEELVEQLKSNAVDEVTLLRVQTREHREHIEATTVMTDEQLMAWVDQQMDETRLYTDSNLTLKTMANSLDSRWDRHLGIPKQNLSP